MNFRQLKYFIGVVEAGNMTRAAERLNVAQTALSMQIRQLEENLGVPLLVRHSRGIEPTEAGKLLHSRAVAILKEVDDARRDVTAAGAEIHESIRFGITPALMLSIGSDLIVRVRETIPQVSMSLREAMSHVLIDSLRRGELDYALCYDAPDVSQLSRRAFLQEDLVFVTLPGPEYGKPIALVDVLDETLAMPEPADTVRQAVSRAGREMGLELTVTYEVRSISAMKNLALKGVAASVLPFASVAEEVRNGLLDARPIAMPPIRRILYLVSPSQGPELRSDAAVTVAVRESVAILLELLGPLAHPLWIRAS